MELDGLLNTMDRVAANLAKLEAVWRRAESFIPNGPARGSHPEYDDLCRVWSDLLEGIPEIDGWAVTEGLPDIDELGQMFIDYFEIGEHPFGAHEVAEQPGKDIAEYRYRLNRARRRATRERLEQLSAVIDSSLPHILDGVARDSHTRLEGHAVSQVAAAVDEIERLLGDGAQRGGRWRDLRRHLAFGQGHDWHDIAELDWPGVRSDIEANSFADTDPLTVPDIDLGKAAGSRLTGAATIALPWDRLDDKGFERLLYDLLRSFPEHENVQWLMSTRAPDRGRDLSLDRLLRDSTGGARTERVIVQAKHWLKRSVGHTEVADNLASMKLWQPPIVRGLVIATTGRFTVSAVDWVEKHNDTGGVPIIELWPDSRLETLLAQKPHLGRVS